MKTISIKLPDAILREIAQEAEARRVGKSAVIRDCLERALLRSKKNKKMVSCLELMGDSVGSFRGPRDLSTNRRHLVKAVAQANRSRKNPR
jgi:Arc/MetJ-type ribon-helix-helix transcriptional regulator